MIRMQLYLPEEEHQTLVLTARRKGTSMARIVQSFIKDGLQRTAQTSQNSQIIMQSIASLKIKGGPADLSKNRNHYLYGEPKRNS